MTHPESSLSHPAESPADERDATDSLLTEVSTGIAPLLASLSDEDLADLLEVATGSHPWTDAQRELGRRGTRLSEFLEQRAEIEADFDPYAATLLAALLAGRESDVYLAADNRVKRWLDHAYARSTQLDDLFRVARMGPENWSFITTQIARSVRPGGRTEELLSVRIVRADGTHLEVRMPARSAMRLMRSLMRDFVALLPEMDTGDVQPDDVEDLVTDAATLAQLAGSPTAVEPDGAEGESLD